MNKILNGIIFFIGWILSPFTWWNDILVNIPISYLIANILFYITNYPFMHLMITAYWFTNLAGLVFMYFGGRGIAAAPNKARMIFVMIGVVLLYSGILIYFVKKGTLLPVQAYFERHIYSH